MQHHKLMLAAWFLHHDSWLNSSNPNLLEQMNLVFFFLNMEPTHMLMGRIHQQEANLVGPLTSIFNGCSSTNLGSILMSPRHPHKQWESCTKPKKKEPNWDGSLSFGGRFQTPVRFKEWGSFLRLTRGSSIFIKEFAFMEPMKCPQDGKQFED